MSIKCKIGLHSWEGCKCSACGSIRDAHHAWDGCKCSKCGKMKEHTWTIISNGYKCNNCGEERSKLIFIDDRDKQEYNYERIGDDFWMIDNFRYKVGKDDCWAPDNNENIVEEFGYLYNWETAKKIAPIGWHLPSLSEIGSLKSYIKKESVKSFNFESGAGYYDGSKQHIGNLILWSSEEGVVNANFTIDYSQAKCIVIPYSSYDYDSLLKIINANKNFKVSVRYIRNKIPVQR